jgi:hypothetical protein
MGGSLPSPPQQQPNALGASHLHLPAHLTQDRVQVLQVLQGTRPTAGLAAKHFFEKVHKSISCSMEIPF